MYRNDFSLYFPMILDVSAGENDATLHTDESFKMEENMETSKIWQVYMAVNILLGRYRKVSFFSDILYCICFSAVLVWLK